MVSLELREKYLAFFQSKGHTIIPSASLIPENDPTVLFTTAGMHPLVPYLLGEKHASGTRLVSVQKCIRTQDIDEVGDNRHDTFFEMFGNWSLGDYFKKETIQWSWEFLTSSQWLGLDPRKLAVTVFAGDQDAPRDAESVEIWKQCGMPEHKIAFLPKKNNWWGPAGQTGPCGPDTEMFYWIGISEFPPESSNPGTDEDHWLEIWNDVFMQYQKQADGSYVPLEQKNIDTGMGLERTLMTLNGMSDVFQVDTFAPLIQTIEELSGKQYGSEEQETKSMRIIADHIRTATMIMADARGIVPSNVDQGYVVRRLIRRAVRFGRQLGLQPGFTTELARVVVAIFKDVYSEVVTNQDRVCAEFAKEEEKFNKALEKGLRHFESLIKKHGTVSGTDAFDLFQSYGFPLEITYELGQERGLTIDRNTFFDEFKKHQELSRKGAEQKFKGGMADNSEMSVRYHTATHLLHQALRQVLGDHVAQKGSNITPERLRFDFSHIEKMTEEQIRQVEDIVNEQIKKDLPIVWRERTVEEAKQDGAMGLFEESYAKLGNKVKVYYIGDNVHGYFSKEICGGPHVAHTGLLGVFNIIKEEAVAAGIRRIKATVEPSTDTLFELSPQRE